MWPFMFLLSLVIPTEAFAQRQPWYSYIGMDVGAVVSAIEDRGFACKINFISIDSARSGILGMQLRTEEMVVLQDQKQLTCSQRVIGADLGYRTEIRGEALDGAVTSLVLNVERSRNELRREIHLNYIDKSVNESGMSITERMALAPNMDGCGVVDYAYLVKLSQDLIIFVHADGDDMATCIAYAHPAHEKVRRDKISEVEQRLWDEKVQPALDEGKRRRLKPEDF